MAKAVSPHFLVFPDSVDAVEFRPSLVSPVSADDPEQAELQAKVEGLEFQDSADSQDRLGRVVILDKAHSRDNQVSVDKAASPERAVFLVNPEHLVLVDSPVRLG